jgi:hypothetical protein
MNAPWLRYLSLAAVKSLPRKVKHVRIQIAILSLACAVILAAVALSANIKQHQSGKTETTRESADGAAESSTQPAGEQPQEAARAAATTVADAAGKEADKRVNVTAAPALNRSVSQGGGKTVDVQELLGQARAALGGEAKLNEVKGLTIQGDLRRVTQNQDQSGTLTLDFLLPDKYKRTETLSLIMGVEVTFVRAVNGEQVWVDSHSSASNAQVMISRPAGNNQSGAQQQDLRAEFARYALALLLNPPPSLAAEFSYAGEAEAPGGRADALDIKGANGFSARLFLDRVTHRPLMLSYRGVAPRGGMTSSTAGGVSKEDLDKIVKEAQAKAAAQQEAEILVSFSDYRPVNGIYFPHLITKAANGKTTEEWKLRQFKINPPDLKPQKFEKK